MLKLNSICGIINACVRYKALQFEVQWFTFRIKPLWLALAFESLTLHERIIVPFDLKKHNLCMNYDIKMKLICCPRHKSTA